jgi:hypothetical protein
MKFIIHWHYLTTDEISLVRSTIIINSNIYLHCLYEKKTLNKFLALTKQLAHFIELKRKYF